jgi:hypothetical protein
MAGFEDTTAVLERRKARREIEAQAENDELPPAEVRRERALKQLLRTLDHPGVEPREKSYAAKVILDHSPAGGIEAELRKRLGTPEKELAFVKAWLARLEREQAAELAEAREGDSQPGAASTLPSPTPPAKAEDGDPR